MPYANICVCFVFPVSCQDASSTRIAKRASSVGVGKLAKRRISKRPAACAETERADLHKEIHPVWKKGPQNWTAWNWNSCPNSWIGVDCARATQHDNGGQGRPECSRFYRGGKSICEVAVHKRKLLYIVRKRWYALPEGYILKNWTRLMLGEGREFVVSWSPAPNCRPERNQDVLRDNGVW